MPKQRAIILQKHFILFYVDRFTREDTLDVLLIIAITVWMNTALYMEIKAINSQLVAKQTDKFWSTTDKRTACIHKSSFHLK